MRKISYIFLGIVMLLTGAIWYFNISLTSLPTTFSDLTSKEIPKLDYDRIRYFEIINDQPGEKRIVIEDKGEIESILNHILNSDLRIYNGGRINLDGIDYEIAITLYDSRYRYFIGENYIMSDGAELYKVLDQENELFDYVETVYWEN